MVEHQLHPPRHDHSQEHGHSHDHGVGPDAEVHTDHHHDHAPVLPVPGQYRAFAIGIGLNLGYAVIEAIVGISVGSMALLADAAHNLGDVLGLALAWGAVWMAQRPATRRRSYGHGRATILAAWGNAMLVFLAVGGLTWEAVSRLSVPAPVPGGTMMIVAGIGVIVNVLSALLFLRGSSHDLNRRGAMLHLFMDAVVSVGVVAGGAAIMWTGWNWLDPAIALAVGLVIIAATWGLLRDSVDLMLDATPRHIEPDDVLAFLSRQTDVIGVHDLHIWALSTTRTALTGHVVIRPGGQGPDPIALADALRQTFRIDHATIQVELHGTCQLDCLAERRSSPA